VRIQASFSEVEMESDIGASDEKTGLSQLQRLLKLRGAEHVIALLFVMLVTWLSYGDILSYGLTGCDTLTLIETGQVHSWADVRRTFTSSLMEGTAFADKFRYYRPLSSLGYALDYWLWGLEPFGYQLHNFLVHLLNGSLVYGFARLLTGQTRIGVLAACLFVAHPILVETVPGIPRRQDLWGTSFTLGALLANALATRGPRTKPLTALGCLCLALGLLTKESAALIVPYIFLYTCCFGDLRSRGWRYPIWRTLPYVATALPLIAWRSYMLEGMGGTWRQALGSGPAHILLELAMALFSPLPHVYKGFAFPILLLALTAIGILPFVSRIITWSRKTPTGKTTVLCLLMGSSATALYVLTGVFGPWMAYGIVASYSIGLASALTASLSGLLSLAPNTRLRGIPPAIGTLFWILVLAGQYRYSPALVHHEGWDESAKINQQILDQIEPYTGQFPDPGLILIRKLPWRHFARRDPLEVQSVSYLKNYSIKSYLNLKHPGNEMRVVVKEPFRSTEVPEFVTIIYAQHNPERAELILSYSRTAPERKLPKKRRKQLRKTFQLDKSTQ
jgi:hypothetical protein